MDREPPRYLIYIFQGLDILIGHVDRHLLVANNYTGDRRRAHRVVVGRDIMERGHKEDVGLDGSIILQWVLNEWCGDAWTGLILLGVRQVAGTCECGNEPSGSIKRGEFLE